MTGQLIDLPVQVNTTRSVQRLPLPALTGIRFFAAMQVVFFHFGSGFAQRHGAPRLVTRLLSNGWIAVTLFFILSGFILSYTYCGQIQGGQNRSRFWQARFARIYPVYFLSLLLMLPFVSLNAGSAVSVLTMVQSWNPLRTFDAEAWNAPAWTLSAEAFFYLCFPFILPHFETAKTRTLQMIILGLLGLIVFGHTMTALQSEFLARAYHLPAALVRFPEFVLGMLAGIMFMRRGAFTRAPLLTTLSLLAAFVIEVTIQGVWTSLAVIPFIVLIYALASGGGVWGRVLSTKTFLLLGGASYSIYLLQVPVRDWVHAFLSRSANLSRFDMLLSPVILVAISIGVFLYIEEPAREFMKGRFRASAARRVRSAA